MVKCARLAGGVLPEERKLLNVSQLGGGEQGGPAEDEAGQHLDRESRCGGGGGSGGDVQARLSLSTKWRGWGLQCPNSAKTLRLDPMGHERG